MAFEEQSSKKIVLYEYDSPVSVTSDLLNFSAGIWSYTLTPGDITVADDNSNTGYYSYANLVFYNVQSVVVDDLQLVRVDSIADLYIQDGGFYYDYATTKIYISFTDYEPPLGKQIYISATVGFCYNGDATSAYFNGGYYDPRLLSVMSIKKSKDPLFYGLLKFESGTVKLINEDGEFDDWRSRNLYRQATRVLVGESGDAYSSYIKMFSGIIGNDSRSWSDISIKVEDVRSALSNPIPYNTLTKTDYPYLADSNVDKVIPIAYGAIRNAPAYCLNEEETGSPATYTFKFCDTEFNNATELTAVYVAGTSVNISGSTIDLTAGTFTLTSVQVNDQFGDVTCDFTGSSIVNGVDIIKDLMLNYANTTYISSLWDLTETAAAQAIARSTSLYLKSQVKLSKALEQICVDIDGLFFAHDNGLWTIRIYDEDREPVKTIEFDEFIGEPDIDNSSDEFLSSVIIQYNKDQEKDEYYTYEETAYIEDVFDIYKSKQSKTIETGLTTEADAILKAQTIMDSSKLVQDIVKRKLTFNHYDLEIMDFVICDPRRRYSETDTLGVWEVIGKDMDLINFTITVTLRYIKTYTLVVTTYSVFVDENGDYIADESGYTLMGAA